MPQTGNRHVGTSGLAAASQHATRDKARRPLNEDYSYNTGPKAPERALADASAAFTVTPFLLR